MLHVFYEDINLIFISEHAELSILCPEYGWLLSLSVITIHSS
jgi:hypothetical protein